MESTDRKHGMLNIFYLFDVDNDYNISAEDFDIISSNLAAIRGWDLDSPEFEPIYENFTLYFEELREMADENNDGLISPMEWARYWVDVSEEELLAQIKQWAILFFDLLDADNDGEITLEEYTQFLNAFEIKGPLIEKEFRRFDTENKGVITREAMINNSEVFFVGLIRAGGIKKDS